MALDRLLRSLFDLADTLAEARPPSRVSAPQAAEAIPNPSETPLPPSSQPTGGPRSSATPQAGTPVPPSPAIGQPKPRTLTPEEHESQRDEHQAQIESEQSLRRELLDQMGLLKKVPKKQRALVPRWYKAMGENHPARPAFEESLAREQSHRQAVERHSTALANEVGLRVPPSPAATPVPPAPPAQEAAQPAPDAPRAPASPRQPPSTVQPARTPAPRPTQPDSPRGYSQTIPPPPDAPLPPENAHDRTGGRVLEGVGSNNARDYTRALAGEEPRAALQPAAGGASGGVPPTSLPPAAAAGAPVPGPEPRGTRAPPPAEAQLEPAGPQPEPILATPAAERHAAPQNTPPQQQTQSQDRLTAILGRIFELLARWFFGGATRVRNVAEDVKGLTWGQREERLRQAGGLLPEEQVKARLAMDRKPTRRQVIQASEAAEQEQRDQAAAAADQDLAGRLKREAARVVGRFRGRRSPAAAARPGAAVTSGPGPTPQAGGLGLPPGTGPGGPAGPAATAARTAAAGEAAAGATPSARTAAAASGGGAAAGLGGLVGLLKVGIAIQIAKLLWDLARVLIDMPDVVDRWSKGLVESKRELAEFNAGIANAVAKMEYTDRLVRLRMARDTGGSASVLGDQSARLREELQPIRSIMGRMGNQLNILLVLAARIAGNVARVDLALNALDKITRIGEKLLGQNQDSGQAWIRWMQKMGQGDFGAAAPIPMNPAGDQHVTPGRIDPSTRRRRP